MIGHLERTGSVDREFLEAHATGADRLLEHARAWSLERAAAIARIEPREIASLAEEYAAADPALIRCGWGVERNRNGEAAVAAILALPAVAGKFGKRGGGYALSASEGFRVNASRLSAAPEPSTRAINMSQLGRALLEETPEVRLLFVYDANPAVTLPDHNRVRKGLLREDLYTVVFDQVMTDTARYADVVLPATTFLEQSEVSISYGTYVVQLSEPVIEPVGEARPNAAVFRSLAERLDQAPPAQADDDLLRRALESVEGRLAVDPGVDRLERIRREGILDFDFPGARPVQFSTVLPGTPDGKARLWPHAWGPDPYCFREDPGDDGHGLALISPSSDRSICSTLAELIEDVACLEMSPIDAAARGLRDGAEVSVHNDWGEVQVPMRISAEVRAGVVQLPKGLWTRHTRNGSVGSALVPDDLSVVSGGACFNDARVEVTAVGGAGRG
jgi:anaerobic selenocysteine-containing dehydrogenase